MKALKFNLLILISTIALTSSLSACASLRTFIIGEANEPETRVEETETNYGIDIKKENYYQAMARWPWADSSQLHRRALILSLGPTDEMLTRLDSERDEDVEIRILTELAIRNPKRFGISARNE